MVMLPRLDTGTKGSVGVSSSCFAVLPPELLFKILDPLDDKQVLRCAEISSLNSVAVEILLLRNGIQDPGTYCEVQVRLPDRLSNPSLTDAMSALLASKHQYGSIDKWRCIVRPSRMYDAVDVFCDEDSGSGGPVEDPDAEPVAERAAFMFGRIARLLSRVDALEEVWLEAAHWTWFSAWFSCPLEDVLNRIIFEKGCSRLHLDTGLTTFANSHNWKYSPSALQAQEPPASNVEAPPQISKSTLSRIFTKFTRGLSSGKSPYFTNQALDSSTRRSRLVKVQMNSLFFNPKTLPWISDLLSISHHLVDFTVALNNALWQSSDFVEYGLPVLLRTAPHLKALTLLRTTEESFRNIAPQLHLFKTLERLTIRVNINFQVSSLLELLQVEAPVSFIPRNVNYRSISPELISYTLLGIPTTKIALKQIELVYQEVSGWVLDPPSLSADTTSIREFFDRISIAVKFPMEARYFPADETPAWRPDVRTVYTDSLTRAHALLKRDCVASEGKGFTAVDVFQVDCNPLELQTRESIESCVNLIQMFPQAKAITLQNVRHSWEAWKPLPAYTPPKDTVDEIVRRVYSSCPQLRGL